MHKVFRLWPVSNSARCKKKFHKNTYFLPLKSPVSYVVPETVLLHYTKKRNEVIRVLTRNLGKMMFLRHLGKSVKLKTYPCTIRHVKGRWGSVGFPFGFFVLKRSLWILFLGIFPCPQTMHKLLWNSKNVTNITKTLNVRENKTNISWPDWEIHFS